jgi:hypothetical protein
MHAPITKPGSISFSARIFPLDDDRDERAAIGDYPSPLLTRALIRLLFALQPVSF